MNNPDRTVEGIVKGLEVPCKACKGEGTQRSMEIDIHYGQQETLRGNIGNRKWGKKKN